MMNDDFGMVSNSGIGDELIELIYDTALNPEQWPVLLAELDRQVAFSGVQGEGETEGALSRHLERAIQISERMAEQEEHVDLLDATLNQLPLAALLVDERAGIIAANRLARDLAGRQSLLSLTGGRLQPVLPQARKQLHSLLKGETGTGDPTGSIVLGSEGIKLSMKVMAIDQLPQRRYNNVCLVLVAEMGVSQGVSVDHLMSIYGLTRAEARLTSGLVAGDELKALATEYGVSYNTVRSQLRSILGKLGIQRQSELVAKVLSDPLVTLRAPTELQPQPDFHAMTLPDGRRLAWCEYGPAGGRPVILSHASLWSRLQQHPDDGVLLYRHGIRLIVPDRPGYGRSDPLPGRSIADWPADVLALADHLGIGRFATAGIMLGGEYALAVAAIAAQRVDHVVLLGAYVSPHICPQCAKPPGTVRMLERMSIKYPRLLTMAIQSVFREMLRRPDTFVSRVLPVIGPKDQAVWEGGDVKRLFLTAFKEANRQGLAKAIVEDWGVLGMPLPYRPEDIEVPVTLWHGTEDPLSPFDNAQTLAERLPNGRLHVIDDGNSYTFLHQWEDALALLATG